MSRNTGFYVAYDAGAVARLLYKFERFRTRIDRNVERVLDRTAIRTQRGIVTRITNWPAVDTGEYRRTVTVEKSKLTRTVGPTVHYAEWVELGTSRMKARPSTLPAWMAERPVFLRELREAVQMRNLLR